MSSTHLDSDNVPKIGDVQEFLEQVHVVLQAFPYRPTWWRGHAVAAWQLLPSVHRRQDVESSQYEHGITTRFIAGARPRYPAPPPKADMPSWLALMQHYGLPTRLMDWSESPLVGLYFAVCNPKRDDSDGAVWALDPSTLNHRLHGRLGTFDFEDREVAPLLREIRIPYPDEKPRSVVALTPSHVDHRMMIQQSSFTIHGPAADLRGLESHYEFLQVIRVRHAQKASIRDELQELGYSRAFLFPDLENLARFERDRHFPPVSGPRPPPTPLAFPSSGWSVTLEAPTIEELERTAREWVREQAASGHDVSDGWSPSRAKRNQNGWEITLLVIT